MMTKLFDFLYKWERFCFMVLGWWKYVNEIIVLVVKDVGFELLELWLWGEEWLSFGGFGG